MTAEDEIHPNLDRGVECFASLTGHIVGPKGLELREVMVQHEHPKGLRPDVLEGGTENLPVPRPNPPSLYGGAEGTGEPLHGHIVGHKGRRQVGGDVSLVAPEGRRQASHWTPPGIHVMIPRNDENRRRYAIEHRPRGLKFRVPGPLCQVAAEHHKINRSPIHFVNQGIHNAGVGNTPEMQIRQVGEGHDSAASHGYIFSIKKRQSG